MDTRVIHTKVAISSGASDREIVFSRVFDAPRELVWEAWTEAKHFARWWGPHAVTNPVCELDVRPGGAWRVVMRLPAGVEYPLKGEYLQVVEPERLIFTADTSEHPASWHASLRQYRKASGTSPHDESMDNIPIVMSVTFETHPLGTSLSITNRFGTAADLRAHQAMGQADGWTQSLERLAEVVEI